MSTLIVTFDLATPVANRERLVHKLRGFPTWACLGATAYLVRTDKTVVQVRDDLKQVLNSGDKLFVGNCPVPSAWYGQPEDVSKWILENQPQA